MHHVCTLPLARCWLALTQALNHMTLLNKMEQVWKHKLMIISHGICYISEDSSCNGIQGTVIMGHL